MQRKIALVLCAYELPGDPCAEPCGFCLGQAQAVMEAIMDEDDEIIREIEAQEMRDELDAEIYREIEEEESRPNFDDDDDLDEEAIEGYLHAMMKDD